MKQSYKEYLLVCLAEECAEVIQNCTKIQRFGWDERKISHSPFEGDFIAKGELTNEQKLNVEYNDVLAIVELLQERDVSLRRNEGLIKAKKIRTIKWASHAVAVGKLDKVV